MNVLHMYTIFFNKSTNVDTQITIQNLLGVNAVQHYKKYLGLPSLVGCNKKEFHIHQAASMEENSRVGG